MGDAGDTRLLNAVESEPVEQKYNFSPASEEDDAPQIRAPSNVSEKRRLQNAIFDAWITSSVGREQLKPKLTERCGETADDEQQSIHSLLAQQQHGNQIVKNPRDYQIELFERAKRENTIAVLDTGSGKTLIAVLLLRWIIDNEVERRAAGSAPKISFFLVASVTLVYQQYSVLECNLDHKVARLCGADGVDSWNFALWQKLFHDHKVIVCTADILLHCLSHSFLSMKQINLLIFDEAHHTKKNHSYARIIKDFFVMEDLARRPRVFGMTASPIDAKTDVLQAAADLEALLNCKIATTQDMSLAETAKRPKEEFVRYEALPKSGFETPLLQEVKTRYGHISAFKGPTERATEIAQHLGRWCADAYLGYAFAAEKSVQYEANLEKIFRAKGRSHAVPELDEALRDVREACEHIVQRASSSLVCIHRNDLSSKVKCLRSYLAKHFERESNHRCIVFVERRHTARVLGLLFQRIKTAHMRPHFLVGSNSGSNEDASSSFREQVLTLLKFRKGEFNCLFATSVAEEGLDVPDCNLVVRFDMYRTMIQYVQSRGRARTNNSKFLHMIENGNSIHQQTQHEVRYQELAMRSFCTRLPDDRKLVGNSDILQTLLDKEKGLRVYTDPVAGAKLTYANALVILNHFVSAIPTESEEPLHPVYVVEGRGGKYVAEVVLPENAPIQSIEGRPHTKKVLAKRSAAFDACLELRKKKYINEHFMPIYQKKLPAMRNALLAVDMKKTNQYEMKVKPTTWEHQRGVLPSEVWATIVDFPETLSHAHQALMLLTRSRMPQFPCFPVFLDDGRRSTVVSASLDKPLRLEEDELAKFTRFTMRIFEDVFSKTYEEDMAKLTYWIAPANCSLPVPTDGEQHGCCDERVVKLNVRDAIDWKLVEEVYDQASYQWTPSTPDEFLKHRLLVDVWDGSRKFYSHEVDRTRKATDPIPDGVAKSKLTGTILDYSISLWKKARAARDATWLRDQPVMRGEKVLARRNMLAPPEQHDDIRQSTLVYLCPQPLRISTLTPEVATSCFVWPAVIHRFESHLISLEGCAAVGVRCSPKFALAAFTKDSDNQGSYEHEERVNFRRGMGENYERLEFIGDTFLKTATTISSFLGNPAENEFELHVRRMQMLCNRNLFETAVQRRLYVYIRSLPFTRRLWYPEGMKLLVGTGVVRGQEREMFHDARTHTLGEKTIADVCEALIGAAFLSYHQQDGWQAEHWDEAVRAVTILVNSPDHTMTRWSDYEAAYQKPPYQVAAATAVQQDLAEKVERAHAYRFTYPRLLYSAFLHPSMPFLHERMPSYQRLEFLGDALLDQASITYLFHAYPDKDPQWLTEHKMAMVSNKFLVALCVTIGFHTHLRHYHARLEPQIRDYAVELAEARRAAAPDARDFWTAVSDPPKCLPDILEAYVGALFVDSGFAFAQVQRFFDAHVRWYFADMRVYDAFARHHPCTLLHHRLQASLGCADYRLLVRELPSVDGVERADVVAVVMVHDRIVAHCEGKSARYARLRVAGRALEVLDGLAPFEYRARFGCDCRGVGEGEGDGLGGEGLGGGGIGVDCSV